MGWQKKHEARLPSAVGAPRSLAMRQSSIVLPLPESPLIHHVRCPLPWRCRLNPVAVEDPALQVFEQTVSTLLYPRGFGQPAQGGEAVAIHAGAADFLRGCWRRKARADRAYTLSPQAT